MTFRDFFQSATGNRPSGDIVLASIPQAHAQFKLRPALVLCLLPPFADFLFCGMSTQLRHSCYPELSQLTSQLWKRAAAGWEFAKRWFLEWLYSKPCFAEPGIQLQVLEALAQRVMD